MRALFLLIAFDLVASSVTHRVKLHRRPGARTRLVTRLLANEAPQLPTPIDPMRNLGDTEYVANVTLGTPPQTFSVIMDTGSANVWVPGVVCKDAGCKNMRKFDQTKSSTYQNESTPFILVYGTGSCLGHLAKDNLGLSPDLNVSIQAQEWGYATQVAKFFEQVPDCDGIWGMGLQILAEPPTIVPPLDNMAKQGIIAKRQFGVFLDSNNDENSEITWGEPDPSHFTGAMKYYPYRPFPISLMYYMVGWQSMSFKNKTVAGAGCTELLPCLAVVDTGTSLMIGPQATVNEINANLSINPDCSNFGKGDPLFIKIGQDEWEIPSSVYTIKDPDTGKCVSGIAGTPLYQGFWIFGDTFLRAVYTLFDNDQKRFGMARSAGLPPRN